MTLQNLRPSAWGSFYGYGATVALALALLAPSVASGKDFAWYCESSQATKAQKYTVEVLIRLANEGPNTSCQDIQAKLSKREFVNIAESGISDLSPLAEFSQIESLDLSHNLITSTEALENLPKLDRINISGNQLTKFPNFRASKKLEMINVGFNPISEIENISHLSSLKKLEIDATDINDFSAIRGDSLRELSAKYLRGEPDFSTLGRLPDLRALSIDESHPSDDLSVFSSFPNLRKLSSRYNGVKSVAGISKLRKLRTIVLEGNDIREITSGQLPTSTNTLDISNNPIEDFAFLSKLTKLSWTLNLDKTGFSDWSQVSALLPKLRYFYASFTKLKSIDIRGKQNWQELTIVDLSGNDIPTLAPLKNVTATELYNFLGPEYEENTERNCPTSGVPKAVSDFCSL